MVKKEIENRSLNKQVKVLGRYPASRMPSFFSHADALLVSLKKSKAFSMVIPAKIQTYLKSGIPLIGVLDGDGRKVIDESNAGITCKAGDHLALAKIFQEINKLPKETLKIMGDNGKIYAKQYFDKESQLLELENLFHEASKV